jgi:hypothetical protein
MSSTPRSGSTSSPTLEHFRYRFEQTLSGRWLLNSLIGLCVGAITLATALPAGCSLARMGGRSAEMIRIGIFLTDLVPRHDRSCRCREIITMIGRQNCTLIFFRLRAAEVDHVGCARRYLLQGGGRMAGALIASVPRVIATSCSVIAGITGGVVK